MTGRMPRQGPSIIGRPRIEEWLGRFKGVPVRFLIAPPGFGKTMAILGYLRHQAPNGVYCAVSANATKESVWASVTAALGEKSLASHDEVVRMLEARAPLELALDCAGVPEAGGVRAILRLAEDVPEGISLLVACRSRSTFEVRDLVSRGLATLCDSERLAFTADEIRHLAQTCGVRFAHVDVVRLLDMTEGWPVVVSGAVVKAAEDNCGLGEAFENWRTRRGHFFNEFIGDALSRAPEELAALVLKLIAGSQLEDVAQLRLLEGQGLFVVHTADGYHSLRALTRSRLHNRYASSMPPTPMRVRLFGWFAAEIGQRQVQWIRRRDRQIFQYIALRPGSIVSRAELGEVFWPGCERHLVSQSLRSACSNIRKAIAQLTGFDQVEAYFRTSNQEVSIDLDNVMIDVKSFVAHATDGDSQFDRGDLQAALVHYRNAEGFYSGALLIGDANEPWVSTQAAELEQRHLAIVKRMAEIPGEIERRRTRPSHVRLATGA
jgi:Bacterial transcriptional activator domain